MFRPPSSEMLAYARPSLCTPLSGFPGIDLRVLTMSRKADPQYEGRYTVPCLWDKKTHTVVNNESSEIIRMLYSAFDDFLEPHQREVNKPGGGFYPSQLQKEIDEMNEWVYNTVNNGVYKCGFSATQEAYDANVYPLFKSLDRLESHLSEPSHQPYLFGQYITEADIRLYTTMARFDVAYYNIFNCNLKMIRHDYPLLSRWLRNLYWDESETTNGGVFKHTTYFDVYKYGYLKAKGRQMHGGSDVGWPVILPRGPNPDIEPLTDEEEQLLMSGKLSGLKITTQDGKPVNGSSSANPFSANGNGMGAMFSAETDSPAGNVASPSTDPAVETHKEKLARRTTHSEENKKWYKEAKKAEKVDGAPYMHLAL